MECVIRNARLADGSGPIEIGIAEGRIVAIGHDINSDAQQIDAGGCLVVPGLVETHFHLDKTCIMDRCQPRDGTVAEAVKLTSAAKSHFTPEDVYARGSHILERAIGWGTMRMRTHVEVDPGIGMRGFEGVQQLAKDFRWGMDIELCVFPQEGLLNNPGTDELLIEGLRRGAKAIGAVPYIDSDPRGQIDRIFEIARDFDVDIDMHLDMGDTPDGMQVEYVCRKADEFGWGGRVAVGHVTQMSLVAPDRFRQIAKTLANAGVAVSVLPATDLYLMGRKADCCVPRGVTKAEPLREAGVLCSISTNNVLNPFTPYGDGNLLRMANLYANVCQVARSDELSGCLDMITTDAAKLMRLTDYGLRVGAKADLILLDAKDAATSIAALAQPLWGMKAGKVSFTRSRPVFYRSSEHVCSH
ncbi:MAG: amidohydrolase family protein [Beijerinckiaceae bacterium]|nr:amidohydrolase family protein [Beijerinckiaceae bacterium]